MKPRYQRLARSANFHKSSCTRIVVSCLACGTLAFSFSASAADGDWTGEGEATWDSTDTNWSGVPAGTPWDITNGLTNRAVFATAGAAPVISGSVYTNGMSITETVTVSGGTDINLVGTTPVIDASADATISSVIAGTSALTKAGIGRLTLSGVNTYSGLATINAGTVTVENDQSGATGGWSIGPASAAATTVNFISGSTIAATSGKKIQIGNTAAGATGFASALVVAGTVNNSGTLLVGRNAALTLNSGASWSQNSNMSLTTFGGTPATLTINAGAAMTYAGANTVKLNLNNASSSNAILTINGTGLFTTAAGFENALNSNATGNSRVTLTGGGTIKLSANVSNLTTQTQLTLGSGGGVIDNNSFNATLSGIVTAGYGTLAPGVSGSGGLTSRGSGILTLSGANTYTGITTVASGTVTVENDQSAANGGWSVVTLTSGGLTATANFNSGSTVAAASGKNIQVGPSANSGSYPNSTLNVAGSVSNAGTLNVQRAGTLNLNSGASWTQDGAMTIQGRGGASAAVTINSGASLTYSGTSVSLSAATNSGGSGTLTIDGTGLFTTAGGFLNSATGVIGSGKSQVTLTNGGTVKLSANVTDFTTQSQFTLGTGGGVIDNNGFNTTLSGIVTAGFGSLTTGITGTGSLTSTGSGTLTLSGLNTYSGDTTVSSGTLTLGQINGSNEASTVSIASDAVLNLTFDGTDTVDKLFLNGVQQPAGVYGSGNSGGRITGTGTLTVSSGPASGYTSWITSFGLALADQDPTDDPDNDGVNNLVEFVLNGNPSLSDNSILPKLVVTSSDFEFTYQRRDDSVSPETTQTFQWGTTLTTWPGSAVIPATSGTVGVATITVSPGIPNDAVTDTVKISIPKTEAGAAGKLFGRQQVVKP